MICRIVQNCHHFHKCTQSALGEGVNGRCMLFKNVDYDANIALSFGYHTRSLNINIFKVLFCKGVTMHRCIDASRYLGRRYVYRIVTQVSRY